MAITGHGDIVTPDDSDGFSVPADMLTMAQSLEPRVIDQYASKAARNTATSALTGAGKRVVAWVDGGVGLCVHNGTAWENLSPPKTYVDAQVLAARVGPTTSSSYTAASAVVTTPSLVNGQMIDIDAHASIRVDGSTRQTAQFGVSCTNVVAVTPVLQPEMLVQPAAGTTDEYFGVHYKGRFYAAGGAVTVKFTLVAGAGTFDLVMQQAQAWVTVWPVDAA